MDSKDTTKEEESKVDSRVTEKEVVALKVSEKVIGRKEEEKAVVTRGRVFKCGKVGHKAVECMVHAADGWGDGA